MFGKNLLTKILLSEYYHVCPESFCFWLRLDKFETFLMTKSFIIMIISLNIVVPNGIIVFPNSRP